MRPKSRYTTLYSSSYYITEIDSMVILYQNVYNLNEGLRARGAELVTRNEAVTGAARTFLNGTFAFEIESTTPSTHHVSFTVKVVETNQLIANVTNYLLTENIWTTFNYTFYSPTGGALTMRLTVTSAS